LPSSRGLTQEKITLADDKSTIKENCLPPDHARCMVNAVKASNAPRNTRAKRDAIEISNDRRAYDSTNAPPEYRINFLIESDLNTHHVASHNK